MWLEKVDRPRKERGAGARENAARGEGCDLHQLPSGPPDYSSCGKSVCITSLVVAIPGNGPRWPLRTFPR
eukprot:1676849-Pyramimonas_sp.AAC.1